MTANLGFVKCLYDLVKNKNIPYICRGQVAYLMKNSYIDISTDDYVFLNDCFLNIPEELMPDILLFLEGKELPIHDINGISLKGCIWAYREAEAIQHTRWGNIQYEGEYHSNINSFDYHTKSRYAAVELIGSLYRLNNILNEISKSNINNNEQDRNYYYSYFIKRRYPNPQKD